MKELPDAHESNPLLLSDDVMTVPAEPAPIRSRASLFDHLRRIAHRRSASLAENLSDEAPRARSIRPSRLPQIEREEPSGTSRATASAHKRMTILVVEDDAQTARALMLLVGAMGHKVIAVADGNEAWSVLRRSRVSLVISDWMVPGLDGLELCRRIRARRVDHYTYVVLVTGKGGDVDRLEGLRAGADDVLAKSLDLSELAAPWRSPGASWQGRRSWNGRTPSWPSWPRPIR